MAGNCIGAISFLALLKSEQVLCDFVYVFVLSGLGHARPSHTVLALRPAVCMCPFFMEDSLPMTLEDGQCHIGECNTIYSLFHPIMSVTMVFGPVAWHCIGAATS